MVEQEKLLSFRSQVLIAALVSLLSVAFYYTPWGAAVSRFGYDYLFAIRGELGSPEEVVLVVIDEDSFNQLDISWPWPRSVHAKLADTLFAEGARAVAFDVLFAEPAKDPADDAALAATADHQDRVVFVSHIESAYNELGYIQDSIVDPVSVAEKASKPLRTGFDNVHVDPDGSVRRLALKQKGETAFAVKAGEAFLDSEPLADSFREEELVLINYVGPRGTISVVPYYRALAPAEYLTAGFFQDKLVFVGRAVSSEVDADKPVVDHFAVPYSRFVGGLMPGVEIHANIAFNILADIFIIPVSTRYTTGIAFILGLAGGILFLRIRLLFGGLVLLFICASILVGSVYAFSEMMRYVNYLELVSPLIACYSVSPISHYLVARKQRNFIRKAFSTYLAPSLVKRLIDQPDQLELGGEVVDGTVMFLDMAGFTALSEKLTAKELIEMLNRNLGRFAEIILKWDGMIDKYIGDCIMAVWGVPLPQSDHAERSCHAALDIQDAMRALVEAEQHLSGSHVSIRVGLNSGQMIAGNIGGGQQFDYTVLGNEVNLASRLEGINKYYGTDIIISGSVADQLPSLFELREVDLIRVVGQQRTVRIFELLGRSGTLSELQLKIRNSYAEALKLYRERRWEEAYGVLVEVLSFHPSDGPSAILLTRCTEYMTTPPPEDWEGVHQMTSK